jgi:glycosyltransferase involved in cell wall biosynthesis
MKKVSNKRVLFLIPSVGSGGIETYLLRFLEARSSEIEATIVVRSNHPGDLFNDFDALRIPMRFLPFGYFNPYRWVEYFIYFKKGAFSTICDFNANFGGLIMLLARIAKISNRIAFYRQGSNHFRSTFLKRVYNYLMNRLIYRNSTYILANSIAGLDYFFPYRKLSDQRFKVVYNGVDLSKISVKIDKEKILEELSIPKGSFIVGHVGRVDKSKNHKTIFKVVSSIIKNNPQVILVLCGTGTDAFHDKINELGLHNNTRLLGYRSDVYAIMQVFDLFYFPSITEGQPNALLEAMALGIPIIASDIKPIREIMPEDSLLFDPFNTANVVEIICDIVKNKQSYVFDHLTVYVSEKFNIERNYSAFLEIINNNEAC